MNLFDNKIELNKSICHSGGADGSDYYWKTIGKEYGVITKDYSYNTEYHTSDSKVEISKEDYEEGVKEINKANRYLGRYGIHKYMNLLARNWSQVKNSKQIFAIGYIINPGEKTPKGYYSKSKYQSVDGGTGYAVQMGIIHKKDVYVFDLKSESWFRWSHSSMSFVKIDVPVISSTNFAGIGTREITHKGIEAIRGVYQSTYKLSIEK